MRMDLLMDAQARRLEGLANPESFRTCEQCGTCSAACPLTGLKDFNIRRILRHVELERIDPVTHSALPWSCTTCGRCETACPNGIPILDIVRSLRALCTDSFFPERIPPCVKACPAGIHVPAYVRWIAQGRPEEAYRVVLEKVAFPGVLGRVCHHPCEAQCRRAEVNEAISICALKRYAADKVEDPVQAITRIEKENGHKVAVIGSGPAGLTAAYELRRRGYQVTIFEALPVAGGMLAVGIPSYRLPRPVLQREIDAILALGVELRLNTRVGQEPSLQDLRDEGYEAILIAIGAHQGRSLGLPGEEASGVLHAVDFLRRVALGEGVDVGGRVVVIGGGYTAVDAARTAWRLGAKEVTILYRRTRKEMLAQEEEVEEAEKEGVRIEFLAAPTQLLVNEGRLWAVECCRMRLAECDESRRPRPIPLDGSSFVVEADRAILAISQSPDLSWVSEKWGKRTRQGTLAVDPFTLRTDGEGIFAGGDVVGGGGTVIEAIASGKRAALSIDRYLGGKGLEEVFEEGVPAGEYSGKRSEGFADQKRVHPLTIPPSERRDPAKEVIRGFTDEQALLEAGRCLQCDLEWALARKLKERGGSLE